MEVEEEIAAAPSEDNGNVPVDAPSEQPAEETPATEETAQPAESEQELYELPDGRKVDGAGVLNEYINLQKDYTQKAQTLAEIEKSKINAPEKPYEKPDWQPKDWAEAIQVAEQAALEKIEAKEKARAEQRQALEDAVITQLAEVKKLDPNVNENALFLHANEYRAKYGVAFPDLQSAYRHMKDTSELTKKVQTETAKNIAKRNDPVSVSPGATGARPDPSQFQNAREYVRSLQG